MKYSLFTYLFFVLGTLLFISCENEPTTVVANDEATMPIKVNEENSLVSNEEYERAFRADYSNSLRGLWQKPNLVIEFMGDISDKVVVDLGAGTGYFSFPIAKKAKKTIALEITEEDINKLNERKLLELPEELQDQFEARLTSDQSPNLKSGEADIVLIVNTYMFIRNEVGKEYLKKIYDVLPEFGQILIVDFKKKRIEVSETDAPTEFRVPLWVVENDLEEAGFKGIRSNDQELNFQYIVTAYK